MPSQSDSPSPRPDAAVPPPAFDRSGLVPGVLLVAGVALLGFLLASFPARNGDLWGHLAAGRAVFAPGANAPSTVDRQPSGPTWLADLILYFGFRTVGGPGLIVAKGLFIAGLAVVLVLAGGCYRPRAALGAILSLLTIGPWLELRPVLFSYLGVAVTFILLERKTPAGAGRTTLLRAYWPLLALFALWANVDVWFFLGPLLASSYALGRSLVRLRTKAAAPQLTRPGVLPLWPVVIAGMIACSASPRFLAVWDLRAVLGLSPTSAALAADSGLQPVATTALRPDFWVTAWRDGAPAAAYLLLASIGTLSFVLCARRMPWGRLAAWAVFFAFSLLDARAIPFFAIVAGPTLSLNLDEFASRLPAEPGWPERARRRLWAVLGAAAVLLFGAALLASAWAGWLQPAPSERRAWRAEADPSLERVAAELKARQHDGSLDPAGRGFLFAPEAAGPLAWFAPGVATFPAGEPPAWTAADAADFARVRHGLAPSADPEPNLNEVRGVFRRHGLRYLLLFEPHEPLFASAFGALLRAPAEWPLLYLRGRVAVFGWNDPDRPGVTPPWPAVDLARRAFAPGAEDRAPGECPAEVAEPAGWADPFVRSRPLRSIDRDEAAVYLLHQDALRVPWLVQASRGAAALEAAGLTLAPVGGGLAGLVGAGRFRLAALQALVPGGKAPAFAAELARPGLSLFPNCPFGDELLAIRACRRALASDPANATAYVLLGDAYGRLAHGTRQRAWAGLLPGLDRLWKCQAAVAYRQALAVDPDARGAHSGLAGLFAEQRFFDLALGHLGQLYRLTRSAGRRPGESPGAFENRLNRLRLETEHLGAAVDQARKVVEANAAHLPVLERAKLAQGRGLTGQALESLLASDVAGFGPEGLLMELDLLLATGRVREARAWMDPEQLGAIGAQNFFWLRTRATASVGEYAAAQDSLAALADSLTPGLIHPDAALRGRAALAVVRAVSAPFRLWPTPASLLTDELNRAEALGRVQTAVRVLRERADAAVIRAVLALEAGDCDGARAVLETALPRPAGKPARGSVGAGFTFPGNAVAEECLELLSQYP